MEITSDDIGLFCKCKTKLFIEACNKKDESDRNYHIKKRYLNRRIKAYIHKLNAVTISYKEYNEGFKKTLEAMKLGHKTIANCVLVWKKNDIVLIATPDIITRKKGRSRFRYYYEPVDIKPVKAIKEYFRVQSAFNCYVLSKIQGKRIEECSIINGEYKERRFSISIMEEKAEECIRSIVDIYSGKKPEVIISSKCGECRYKDLCVKNAKKSLDLSLIIGMNSKAREQLINQGINDIKKMADADLNKIMISDVSHANLILWKKQAKSLIDSKPRTLKKPDFRKPKTEIYFDIEGLTDKANDYLYGFIVLRNGEYSYKYVFADDPKDEKKVWKGFVKLLKDKDDFVIYHFSPYEKVSIKRMFERYGCSKDLFDRIISNMVDLYPILKKSVVLPVHSYSLKSVAKYLGFEWSNGKARGRQSVIWYKKYLHTKDVKLKNLLLEYNKDDCMATMIIKKWLERLK